MGALLYEFKFFLSPPGKAGGVCLCANTWALFAAGINPSAPVREVRFDAPKGAEQIRSCSSLAGSPWIREGMREEAAAGLGELREPHPFLRLQTCSSEREKETERGKGMEEKGEGKRGRLSVSSPMR